MLQTLHIAFSTIFLDELSSTNDYATALLSKSTPNEGTVISTYNQTGGKGQIGRSWFSDKCKNLTISVILRPHFLEAHNSFYLSMALSIAIAKFIQEITKSNQVCIKWPNDIYVGNRKIAGLLIQQNLQGKRINSTVLGVGINVNQVEFPDDLPNPISIAQIINMDVELDRLLPILLPFIGKWYGALKEGNSNLIEQEYLKHLYRRGEICVFIDRFDKEFEAEIIGVSELGKLIVSMNNRLVDFNMHEIKIKI